MKKAMWCPKEGICKLYFRVSSDEFYPMVNAIKEIPGRKFDPTQKAWYVPITKSNIEQLARLGFETDERILNSLYKKEEPIIIDESKLTHDYFPFQKDGIKQMIRFDGKVLLGDEMGLGKTIQAIGYLNLNPELRPALVICPATLKGNWEAECKKWLLKKERTFRVDSKAIIDVDNDSDIFIINYDILRKFENDIMEKIRPQVVILDECHKIKNSKTNRTKSAKKICKEAEKIIAISGTPIVNRPVEFWNTLNMLRPKLFNNFWQFAQRYCGATHNGWGWNFGGATNLEELNRLLTENVMVRRLKKDVLKDLPEKIRSVIPVEPYKDKERDDYLKRQKQFTNWLMENRSMSQPTILAQIEELKQMAFAMKFENVVEWIEDYIDSEKKLVVFFTHHKSIDAVYEKFSDCALKLDGRTPMKDRQDIVEKFQNDPKYKLFLGNIQAAGVGITLTAADACLFTEFAWTPGDHTQAEDRIHRIGQKNSVNIYYMVATNTIEEDIIEVIDEKRKNLDKVLDGIETDSENILTAILKRYTSREEVA